MLNDSLPVHLDDPGAAALGDHGEAILQALDAVDLDLVVSVAVGGGGVVAPDHQVVARHLDDERDRLRTEPTRGVNVGGGGLG